MCSDGVWEFTSPTEATCAERPRYAACKRGKSAFGMGRRRFRGGGLLLRLLGRRPFQDLRSNRGSTRTRGGPAPSFISFNNLDFLSSATRRIDETQGVDETTAIDQTHRMCRPFGRPLGSLTHQTKDRGRSGRGQETHQKGLGSLLDIGCKEPSLLVRTTFVDIEITTLKSKSCSMCKWRTAN